MNQYENNGDFAYEVVNQSEIICALTCIAADENEWQPYYNFKAKHVPMEVLLKDHFLQWLDSRYGFKAGLLMMEPFTQYDWHVDDRRGVGVNLLLSYEDRSVCMFTDDANALVKDIFPYTYRPDTYVIFNTQVPHCVINFEKPRYLFTIEFNKDKTELSFDDLINDISSNYKGKSNE
jgi:hypothetical protein